MSGFDLASLMPVYLDEVDEQIAALNDTLLKLEQNPEDDRALRDAFRLVHTIKGSSTMMGFDQVKGLTHHLETYFDDLRSGKRPLTRPFLDLCFRGLDALRDYHRDLREQGQSQVDLTGLTGQVIAQLEGSPGEIEPEPEPVRPTIPEEPPAIAPKMAMQSSVVWIAVTFEPKLPWPDMKARLILNRLSAKGQILETDPPADRLEETEVSRKFRIQIRSDCVAEELRTLADVDGVSHVVIDTGEPPPPVVEQAPKPEPEAIEPAPSATPELPHARVTETVRVDVDRLDHLMNLAGELVVSKARFFEISRGLEELFRNTSAPLLASDAIDRLESVARGLEEYGDREATGTGSIERWGGQVRRLCENFREIRDELDLIRQGRERLGSMAEAIHHLSRVSDGIQRGVLETRMVPIGPLFDRFRRVIRDLRHASGKEIDLRIEGEKTELDKRMVDELADPLIHLVRNSVDHGLERPEDRIAAGKPRSGTVFLAASHRGNSVVITVGDDGRGINTEKVRRKAVANGLLGEAESLRLTDRQVAAFIWHPGLSTAEAITDISGRGVGMDIVKSRIEALNGTVDVRSEPNRGTTFTIRLPLTLAIMSVLLVRVGDEAYAIPLDHLDEIVEVDAAQVHRVHGRKSIEIRGRVIALVTLREIFGHARPANERIASDERHTVVLISDGEAAVGLIIDQLLGMQEAVLKSLEKNFRPVEGLSGASILGDGRVSLILDVDGLIEMVARESGHRSRAVEAGR